MGKKVSWVLLALLGTFLVFCLGYYIGRNTVNGVGISTQYPAQVKTTTAPTEQTEASSAGKLDLNTATKEELMTLPGIGSTYAQRILDYREEHGGFDSVSQLLNIKGIGQGTLDKIMDYLTVG